MKLYANGCSFTWGGELHESLFNTYGIMDENNPGLDNKERLSVVWPNEFCKLSSFTESINHSMGCGSNDSIVRKTLEYFVKNTDYENYFVIIQFTEPSRFEFYDDETQSWNMVKNNKIINEKNKNISYLKNKVLNEYYYKHNLTFSEKLFSQINCLGYFFKYNNIKYFFTSMNSIHGYLSDVQQNYCNKNFVWYNNDIKNCDILSMDIEKNSHPTLLGHKQIAQNYYMYYNTLLKE